MIIAFRLAAPFGHGVLVATCALAGDTSPAPEPLSRSAMRSTRTVWRWTTRHSLKRAAQRVQATHAA